MAGFFPLTIVTPTHLAFEGEVSNLIVRTTQGDVGILRNHTNYLAPIAIGRLVIDTNNGRRFGAVNGGFVSMINGECVVSAISFEWADEIDIDRAGKAREKAETLMSKRDGTDIEVIRSRLMRAINRIDVYNISRK